MGKDLGTYFVEVELADGGGYIQEWPTGARYTGGSGSQSPLSAMRLEPPYDNEAEVMKGIKFMYSEGNYACDCNRRLFLARAMQQDDPDDSLCGETIAIKRLSMIRPDSTKVLLLEDI